MDRRALLTTAVVLTAAACTGNGRQRSERGNHHHIRPEPLAGAADLRDDHVGCRGPRLDRARARASTARSYAPATPPTRAPGSSTTRASTP